MPPAQRPVISFAAEPPHEELPHGRWADRLRVEFLAACLRIDPEDEDIGSPGDITWYPDRTYNGRTYVPATGRTSTGFEVYGYVSFTPATDDAEAADLDGAAEFTGELAEDHDEWRLDLCEEVIGSWRGEDANVADMTLVWGRPLLQGGVVATAELADLVVDQCVLVGDRFTLIAPDDYRGDILDIRLFDERGASIASESLYEDDDEE